jgi:hypothetical protein
LEKRGPQGQSRGYTGAEVHNVHCTIRNGPTEGYLRVTKKQAVAVAFRERRGWRGGGVGVGVEVEVGVGGGV